MVQDSIKSSILKRQVSARKAIADKLKEHFGRGWLVTVSKEAGVAYDTGKRFFQGGSSHKRPAERLYDAADRLIREAEKNLEGHGSDHQ